MSRWNGWTRPGVVLFDMDGTLTRPHLDFAAIRRDMGIAPGKPILEALREMSEPDRIRATDILHRHEHHAAINAELNPGCREVLGLLASEAVPTALITRNSMGSVRQVLTVHGLRFGALVTREDEPYKPHPAPIRLALQRLNVEVEPRSVWMVGDGEHDIDSGLAAGVRTVWVSHGQPRQFDASPCAEVGDLVELLAVLQNLLTLRAS
jgi:HAD superfamily hydrolase (TIGR01509 family)